MANNKFYGYTPKGGKGNVGVPYGEDLKFINQNPYEFRKGMDYELTSLGCSRLAESTPDEREKSTENVIKNLQKHPSYYTAKIQWESKGRNYGTQGTQKVSFNKWLKEFFDNTKMMEFTKSFDRKKMTAPTFKSDKMTEPKINTKEEDVKAHLKTSALKEAIKLKVQKYLLEKKGDDDDEMDDDDTDKVATKGAKGAKSKLSKFDQEREAIEKHLEDLTEKKSKELERYKKSKKDKKAVQAYKKAIELVEKDKKKLEKTADKFEVDKKEYIAKDIPNTIKDLEKRLKQIDKEEEEAISKLREDKKGIAETDMTREEQIRLLNIIKENGISLREGTDNIRVYYEIAKTSFLEGLSKGLQL